MTQEKTKAGYVAIVGRPNVGKSTLLNQMLGTKLCITSRKPQTTRHVILGVKTQDNCQSVYVDTPGLHGGQKGTMNRLMNKSVISVLNDVDCALFVVSGLVWNEGDERVFHEVKKSGIPAIVVINKIDTLDNKETLLPHIEFIRTHCGLEKIVPVSAFSNQDMILLGNEIESILPEGEHLFEADQLTDRSERFVVSECIREKIMRQLGDELPYQTAVEIEQFKSNEKITEISAVILVENKGQKKIVIGKGGERIKKIGEEARMEVEKLLDSKVMLRLWVKVKSGWSEDVAVLNRMGIE